MWFFASKQILLQRCAQGWKLIFGNLLRHGDIAAAVDMLELATERSQNITEPPPIRGITEITTACDNDHIARHS
jgi:hypothetical protein